MRTFVILLMLLVTAFPLRAAEFKPAVPGWDFQFPRDHGAHDDFRTEWWYYTGHLRSASGKTYGFEVTFFRVGVAAPGGVPAKSAWELRNISLAHFAITDAKRGQFRYYEKLNRSSPYTANAAAGDLKVFNESWSAVAMPNGVWRVRAAGGGDAVDLLLQTKKQPVIHGENGVSVKAEGVGYASHYYSMTRLAVTGNVTVGGKQESCAGIAWMDHEFGSSGLRATQQGWDWFSVQLDNEMELMLYIIRRSDGSPDVTSSGSLVMGDGAVIHLRREQFRVTSRRRWRSAKSGATYPLGWQISVPGYGLNIELKETMTEQELVTTGSTQVTYWEGAVNITGRFGGNPVSGVGYVEMTGYDKPFRQP